MRVYVGLSGGVDSAVSAALLKEAGHDVTGVFIKIWSPEFLECTWREDRLDALRASVALGIPFKEIDLSQEYLDTVVKDMITNYSAGKTPNPDVLCNRAIKFGSFKKWALEQGAEKIATGHYAQVEKLEQGYSLLRGVDSSKDQSYFLYRLTQDDLSHIFFPVGSMTKKSVREKAISFGLPVAKKPDSQGLCFVGDVSMRDFLKRFIDVKKGPVLNLKGSVVGEHDGAALYTIGERHGFTLFENSSSQTPYYVTCISVNGNSITVSPDRIDTLKTEAQLNDVHMIEGNHPASFTADAVTRYRGKPVQAEVIVHGETAQLRFKEKALVSPGQSVVLYTGDTVLGGGIIS